MNSLISVFALLFVASTYAVSLPGNVGSHYDEHVQQGFWQKSLYGAHPASGIYDHMTDAGVMQNTVTREAATINGLDCTPEWASYIMWGETKVWVTCESGYNGSCCIKKNTIHDKKGYWMGNIAVGETKYFAGQWSGLAYYVCGCFGNQKLTVTTN